MIACGSSISQSTLSGCFFAKGISPFQNAGQDPQAGGTGKG